jgi:small subunit ribosomal protein S21
MLVINIKDNESIDRALKQYKNKFNRSGQMKELRRRKHFTKPSVERRAEVLKASYILEKYGNE